MSITPDYIVSYNFQLTISARVIRFWTYIGGNRRCWYLSINLLIHDSHQLMSYGIMMTWYLLFVNGFRILYCILLRHIPSYIICL